MRQAPPSNELVAQLVDELDGDAQLVDAGEFTLDPAQARLKLREYQLADPNGYLLLLVEIARLADPNRTSISFTLGRPLVVEFESIELELDALEHLLGGVFRSRSGLRGEELRHARVMRLLGLALNAALALEPEQVSIGWLQDSGMGAGLRFVPSGESERVHMMGEESMRPRARFEVHFGPLANLSFSDERELIERHCSFAPFPVDVDGQVISRGLRAGLDHDGAERLGHTPPELVSLSEVTRLGLANNCNTEAPPVLLLLTRGVLSETLELEGLRPGFRAIVDIDARKDLAQAKVLRDPQFDAMLAAVRRAHDKLPPAPVAVAPSEDAQVAPAVIVLGLELESGVLPLPRE